MTWILIPGLGADRRLFSSILDLLREPQVLEFPPGRPNESIEAYAGRMAEQITPGHGLVLCGVSFGGMLASILCRRLDPALLVLMASTPRPSGLQGSLRAFEWLTRVLPDAWARWVRDLGSLPLSWLEPIPPEHLSAVKDLIRQADLETVRHGARLIMEWRSTPRIDCPMVHLHGARDRLIPLRGVSPTHVVRTAGHFVNITHPQPVRAFVRQVLQQLEAGV